MCVCVCVCGGGGGGGGEGGVCANAFAVPLLLFLGSAPGAGSRILRLGNGTLNSRMLEALI